MEQRPISPDDVFWQLASLNQRMARIEQLLELLPILLIAQVDPTHLSIDSAAKIVGVSTKTIRRRIKGRRLRLDVYVGTRHTGVPIEQVVDGWLDLRVARAALASPRTRFAGEEGRRTAAKPAMRPHVSPLPPRVARLATETVVRWQNSSPVENSVARRWQTSSFGEQKSPRLAG